MLFLCAMISKSKSVSTFYTQKALHACYSFAVEEYLFMNLMTWIYPSLSPRHSFQAEVIGNKWSTFFMMRTAVWKAVTLSTIHLDMFFFFFLHSIFLWKLVVDVKKLLLFQALKINSVITEITEWIFTQITLKVIFVILQALFNFQSITFIHTT